MFELHCTNWRSLEFGLLSFGLRIALTVSHAVRRGHREGRNMGLLRIATIIAVGIAVLPSDRDQQQRLYDRAGATAEWVITFCDRNGPTCAKGAELWSQFVAKAEFGAKLAYDTL